MHDLGDELEFYADSPETDAVQLIDLLVFNRSSGLAYWDMDDETFGGESSRCPRSATMPEMAAYMREAAALADRMECG